MDDKPTPRDIPGGFPETPLQQDQPAKAPETQGQHREFPLAGSAAILAHHGTEPPPDNPWAMSTPGPRIEDRQVSDDGISSSDNTLLQPTAAAAAENSGSVDDRGHETPLQVSDDSDATEEAETHFAPLNTGTVSRPPLQPKRSNVTEEDLELEDGDEAQESD